MSETAVESAPCGVCKGSRKEHFDGAGRPITQHVYSPDGGLVSQVDAAKARQAQQSVIPPRFPGTDAQVITRLIQTLMDKGILSDPEALYIFGVGNKPEVTRFVDPVKLFGSGTC